MQKFGSLRSLHILCFMHLPFWYSFVVVCRVFLLPPWPKVSLHDQTGSSNLSLSGMDSVGIPEFWIWHDVLLPKVFVTLKDIISWWKTKIQQLSKYSKVKHTLWITLLFQIYTSKSFLNTIFSENFMVGSIQCDIFNLYSQVAGRGFFFFSRSEWNNGKKRGKKIRIHYQNKRTKTCSYPSPQESFLLRRKEYHFTSWLSSDFLQKSWLDPLFSVLKLKTVVLTRFQKPAYLLLADWDQVFSLAL